MKWLFKWTLRLAAFCVVLIVVLLFSLDSIFKALLGRQIRAGTGMDVKIGKLSVGLLSPVVTIEGFKLYNTAEFGGTPFLDIRELHVEYDRAALAHRILHVKLMRLNLAELNVVKSDAGRTNLVTSNTGPPPGITSRQNELNFSGVDVLNLTVGQVRFIDLKNPRRNQQFNPNLQNQIFRNVKTTADLYGILMMIWLRSGGGPLQVNSGLPPGTTSTHDPAPATPAQILTLKRSSFFSDDAKAASNRGIGSKSFRLTTSTGECM
jgi:hypothetical protein